MSIIKIITGGQTGADQAGWRAAKAAGLACGGWMPPNFATSDGNRPDFASLYGAVALKLDDYTDLLGTVDWKAAYRDRTYLNAADSDACIWFGNPYSPGGYCTTRACEVANIDHFIVVKPGGEATPDAFVDWLRHQTFADKIETLMVAGNRENKAPGISRWAESYMAEVFRLLLVEDAR